MDEEEAGTASRWAGPAPDGSSVESVTLEAPRHLVWLLLRDPSSLDEQEQHTLGLICQEHLVAKLYDLTQSDVKLMREWDFEACDLWLKTCLRAASQIWNHLLKDCKKSMRQSKQLWSCHTAMDLLRGKLIV